MVDVYDGGFMVVVMDVFNYKIFFYGVLDVNIYVGNVVFVNGMVEKFKCDEVFLNFVVIGCYILLL